MLRGNDNYYIFSTSVSNTVTFAETKGYLNVAFNTCRRNTVDLAFASPRFFFFLKLNDKKAVVYVEPVLLILVTGNRDCCIIGAHVRLGTHHVYGLHLPYTLGHIC